MISTNKQVGFEREYLMGSKGKQVHGKALQFLRFRLLIWRVSRGESHRRHGLLMCSFSASWTVMCGSGLGLGRCGCFLPKGCCVANRGGIRPSTRPLATTPYLLGVGPTAASVRSWRCGQRRHACYDASFEGDSMQKSYFVKYFLNHFILGWISTNRLVLSFLSLESFTRAISSSSFESRCNLGMHYLWE